MRLQSLPIRAPFSLTLPRAALSDGGAMLALCAVTVAAGWRTVAGGITVGLDSASFFYPVYTLLGERLRAGRLPLWNPHQFAGAPLLADPQSGWMYLPVMGLFTLFELSTAAAGHLLFHPLLAGLGTYALARALGLGPLGALPAALVYALNGYITHYNVRCFACSGVYAWLPVALFATERALRSRDRIHRTLWWGLGGLAMSQVLAIWLGQGAYYALLTWGAFLLYRTLVSPAAPAPARLQGRVRAALLHGTGLVLATLGLAAAGLLPRIEYNALSTLAGGYGDASGARLAGGWTFDSLRGFLVPNAAHYLGGATLALAIAGIALGWRRCAAPFFVLHAAAVLVLTSQDPTALHFLLSFLPGFDRLHPHVPERIIVVFYLAPAVLAGVGAEALWRRVPRRIVPAAAALAAAGAAALAGAPLITFAVLGTLLALLAAGAVLDRLRRLLAFSVVVVLVADLFAAQAALDARFRAIWHPTTLRKVDLATYYAPSAVGGVLRRESEREASRYFGFEPVDDLYGRGYAYSWLTPLSRLVVGNNRATTLRLEDIQGYNPTQVARYADFMRALNGADQPYRRLNVLPTGLTSPLLDLLNVRYVAFPREALADRPDLWRMGETVYRDGRVAIKRRDAALPRGWLVHRARRVAPGAALAPLTAGRVDPRTTALLEEAPPPLRAAPPGGREWVRPVTTDAERLVFDVRASAPALLVLSEVAYPAWRATVNGAPARLYVANHALRAVAAPAGQHRVELRYVSSTLALGLVLTGVTASVFAALAGVALVRRVRGTPLGGRFSARIRRRRGVPGGV